MTSRETAEDVLREIAERYSGDKMLMHYRDRIERALAGRAEAVYQVRCHDPENSEAWFDVTEYGYRCNVDKGRDARILYTHPPASVPEYDRAMIADMLIGCAAGKRGEYTTDGMLEQARLLREADNASAAKVRTVSRASVPEATDAMVERFARRYYEITGRSIDRAYTFACLTDALQEQRHG